MRRCVIGDRCCGIEIHLGNDILTRLPFIAFYRGIERYPLETGLAFGDATIAVIRDVRFHPDVLDMKCFYRGSFIDRCIRYTDTVEQSLDSQTVFKTGQAQGNVQRYLGDTLDVAAWNIHNHHEYRYLNNQANR